MNTILIIGNVIKNKNNDNIFFSGGVLNAALAAKKAGSDVKVITNIRDRDFSLAFNFLVEYGVEVIVTNNSKTTFVENKRIVEVAPTIPTREILKIKGDYYYFAPSLNGDVSHDCFQEVSKKGKIALSLAGFMNFVKEESIKTERYTHLEKNLQFITHLTIDKSLCLIQEFTKDEDHVAKKYASKGCKEVLIPYHEALLNLRENAFSRCKYVTISLNNRDKIGDIALAAYISKGETVIKEEALFYGAALSCFYMDNIPITNLSESEINSKMIEIGIV